MFCFVAPPRNLSHPSAERSSWKSYDLPLAKSVRTFAGGRNRKFVEMSHEFERFVENCRAFEDLTIGRALKIFVDLLEEKLEQSPGLKNETIGNLVENVQEPEPDDLLSPAKMAKKLDISVRTFNRRCEQFGIEPEYGHGKDARYSASCLSQFKARMKELKKGD